MLIKRKFVKLLMPSPIKTRHAEYSMVYSADDDFSTSSDRLIEIAIESAKIAHKTSLAYVLERTKTEKYIEIWPGEHYKFLAGIVQYLKPKLIIEIGTGKGLSSLTMKKYLSANASIVTFDIFPWKKYPGECILKEEDFADGRLIQYTDDLSTKEGFQKHAKLLKEADFIFVDAAKDGIQEQRLIDNFKTIQFSNSPIFLFDDIRLWNMLKIWREISMPKLDITSFGHWSGTGLVEWKNS